MKTRRLIPIALLSAGLVAFGLQPAHAAGSSSPSARPVVAKLDGGLQILAQAAASGRPVTDQTGMNAGNGVKVLTGARVEHGDVLVNVYVNGSVSSAASDLRALGMRVTATSDQAPERVVAGWLPAAKILDATAIAGTKAITLVHAGVDGTGGGTDSGTVLSQGDAAHHGPQARALGTTGAGVKVGVISDSANQQGGGVATSIASGNLPSGYTVLQDDPGQTDEGRAMSEIIYDEAPGITQMYFSTGTISAAGKATSINNLVASGAKVIADDIFYLDEPMFQDGVVAQAVDAAKAAGVNYFASAGNRAKQSWEGTLTGTNNDFDPGAGTDTIQSLGNFNGTSPYISLQWGEPWGGATTDLALDWYVDDVLVATADDNNITSGIPNEFEQISFSGVHNVGIGIRRVSGAGLPKLKYIAGGVSAFTIQQFPTNSNAINPDAASSAGSLAVAASNWATPTTPEPYSSRGPSITRIFDKNGVLLGAPVVRPKPALDAADAVATSVPGFGTFGGTSAATPSAAGIATLIRSAAPSLTEGQVATLMTDPTKAQACATAAPATDCGAGFIMADLMVASLDNTPPTVSGAVAPAAPNGANGWYTGTPVVTWTVADAQTVPQTTGCTSPFSVTTDGTSSLTCVAKSIGGTAQATVTLKRDASAPTGIAFHGIKKKYKNGKKPKKNKVTCSASDPTSGVASCVISGFSKKKGKHTLTATATNGAGLTSTATFKYTIK